MITAMIRMVRYGKEAATPCVLAGEEANSRNKWKEHLVTYPCRREMALHFQITMT